MKSFTSKNHIPTTKTVLIRYQKILWAIMNRLKLESNIIDKINILIILIKKNIKKDSESFEFLF